MEDGEDVEVAEEIGDGEPLSEDVEVAEEIGDGEPLSEDVEYLSEDVEYLSEDGDVEDVVDVVDGDFIYLNILVLINLSFITRKTYF